jgi:cell division protein FtsL
MKKAKQNNRKLSLFNTLIAFSVICVLLVLYINNIIYVNNLAVKNNELREEIKKTSQSNDILRTEIERLSSFDRIKSISKEKMNIDVREGAYTEKNKIVINKSELY